MFQAEWRNVHDTLPRTRQPDARRVDEIREAELARRLRLQQIHPVTPPAIDWVSTSTPQLTMHSHLRQDVIEGHDFHVQVRHALHLHRQTGRHQG